MKKSNSTDKLKDAPKKAAPADVLKSGFETSSVNSMSVKAGKSKAGKSKAGKSKPGSNEEASRASWTYLSNHAHVLLCLARNGDATLREVAFLVGITERAVQRIVADLENSGVLTRERDGRRNHYEVDPTQPLRHTIEAHKTVNDLLNMVGENALSDKA